MPPTDTRIFEDTIDGYFPLRVSLAQMMDRNGFDAALVSLTQAPVAAFPGLPDDAPVPLTIRAGRAGLIDWLALWLWRDGGTMRTRAQGQWRWLAGGSDGARLDPMTRLAEPAFLHGIGWPGAGNGACKPAEIDLTAGAEAGSGAALWGPLPEAEGIFWADRPAVFGARVAPMPGRYLVTSSRVAPIGGADTAIS